MNLFSCWTSSKCTVEGSITELEGLKDEAIRTSSLNIIYDALSTTNNTNNMYFIIKYGLTNSLYVQTTL